MYQNSAFCIIKILHRFVGYTLATLIKQHIFTLYIILCLLHVVYKIQKTLLVLQIFIIVWCVYWMLETRLHENTVLIVSCYGNDFLHKKLIKPQVRKICCCSITYKFFV